MTRALLSLLIAFCILSQGHGGNPDVEGPCNDADTCETLEEVKNAAIAAVNKAAQEQLIRSNIIRESSLKIQQGMLEYSKEIDKFLAREWLNAFQEGNNAFEEALRQGKELSVFECIVDCELSSRKVYPQIAVKYKQELTSLQGGFNERINVINNQVTTFDTKLNEIRESYIKNIKSAITKISANWSRDQALKALANYARDFNKLSNDFAKIDADYKNTSGTFLRNCENSFIQVTEDTRMCDVKCLQD